MKTLTLPSIEEIKEIKNGNIDVISKYYFENLVVLKRYVNAFCRKTFTYDFFEDYLQELFLHFSKLDFDNASFFGRSCYRVFNDYRYGGARKRVQLRDAKVFPEDCILDKQIKGFEKNERTYSDLIRESNIEEYINKKPDITDALFDYLCTDLAKQQKRVFEQFYWTGKTYNEIAETLNKNPRTVKRTREEIFKKFRNKKEELNNFLIALDYY